MSVAPSFEFQAAADFDPDIAIDMPACKELSLSGLGPRAMQ